MIPFTLSFRAAAMATSMVVLLAACGGGSSFSSGDVVSSTPYVAPSSIMADAKLLVYWMKGRSGALVRASTLVFVPRGAAPVGGWPVVSWVHGTTTAGTGSAIASACSPSTSVTLDGTLTADGFPSGYVGVIANLVASGYAVVAPDFEGLGAVAAENNTPYSYYDLDRSGASVVAAVQAANRANLSLSKNWVSVGHSEGGHAVLGMDAAAAQASDVSFKGSVAFAPFNSIQASIDFLNAAMVADPANKVNYSLVQNFLVGMMSSALSTAQPDFSAADVMGDELLAVMPNFKSKCIFKVLGDVGAAVGAKAAADLPFKGYKATWASNASMKAFLTANDPAVNPAFTLRTPTLILQGGADEFVFEPLQTALVAKFKAAGLPVTYIKYPTAGHASVMTAGQADMLNFLKVNLK